MTKISTRPPQISIPKKAGALGLFPVAWLLLLAAGLGLAGCDYCEPRRYTAADSATFPRSTDPQEVRFFAFGDSGTCSEEQWKVAGAVADKCTAEGCDFGLLLGDIIYPSGVSSHRDLQFRSKLEAPYGGIDVPFYLTLGNHDYDQRSFGRGANYVSYASSREKWVMPAEFYDFEQGAAQFLALGTNLIVHDHEDAVATQGAYFSGALAATALPWRIAFGHHPYISNGGHGNTGGNLAAFFDSYLCGKIDLYLAGHDHNLQVLPGPENCPGTFVVSGGGGAGLKGFYGNNPSFFELREHGFAYIRLNAESILVEIMTADGTVEDSTEIFHP